MGEPFRVIVAGSRYHSRPYIVRAALMELATERGRLMVVHGMCDPRDPATRRAIPWEDAERLGPEERSRLLGADWQAALWARVCGWGAEPHPADWDALGRAAGPLRNQAMADRGASLCLLFPEPGEAGNGTRDMGRRARNAGIPVEVKG